MFSIGALGFLNPWLLAGLVALPILWWLLRAIPPSPKIIAFPGVPLLLGLEDKERQADKTPWWLLLLRIVMIAAILIGFAGPVLNPSARLSGGDGPVLVVMDQGWASAPDWAARKAAARSAIDEAGEAGREVLFWPLASGEKPVPVSAPVARSVLEATDPAPWQPQREAFLEGVEDLDFSETVWLHDGLSHGEGDEELLDLLAGKSDLTLIGPERIARALTPPRLDDGRMVAEVLRTGGAEETELVVAYGKTETGAERRIAVAPAQFAEGDEESSAEFDLPPELISTVSRLVLADGASAGGAVMADGSLSRLPTGLVAPVVDDAIVSLTSASHYLREALEPWAVIHEGALGDIMKAPPAVLVLADHGAFTPEDQESLGTWVEEGGMLIRFAGPRLAAAIGERFGLAEQDPLLPVKLRRGGRVLGGALAWSKPRTLGPFDPDGPFRHLDIPDEVDVRTQVLAEPSPDLDKKVWAKLDDGTPLVTARREGKGWIILFHVTADAEWSSIPLSGLFVEMLGRIMALAPGSVSATPPADELKDTLWRPDVLLDAKGAPHGVGGSAEPVAGEMLAGGRAGPGIAPGVYLRADDGPGSSQGAGRLVMNLHLDGDLLTEMPEPPIGTIIETLGGAEAQRLGPWLLAAAILLAFTDLIATLWLGGRLIGGRQVAAGLLALVLVAPEARAEDAVSATAETTLGYIITGNARVDRMSEQALRGLGFALSTRTSVEPGPPVGVDPAKDEMDIYPVLYWPLVGGAIPGAEGLERLAGYLAGGGMLLIDTQNGSSGFAGAASVDMRQIARALNLPALAPVDGDHVLTRSFYLLDQFPGRWRGGTVWAEAPKTDNGVERDPSIPQFDRVDDNVSPVVVGSADWASAWAVDDEGYFAYPIGRTGDRQREMAYRFGINLVLYALTGNYKSDLVHAPAVLERLGQ
ncbi:DUF4159 domain-containing protein [Rhodobacteraceae bacterium NNCM2]|nr:DUF4159 domain-containing protein [Coraliihabitans acroporae]